MPKIFLSPSTQEYNQYITGAGSEEYFMNLLADAMEPLLLANGIQYVRNDPQGTVSTSIQQSNDGSYDFHLALHSNASGPGSEGRNRGIIAFYYPGSVNGQRAAELFASALREIYPVPDQVTTRSTTTLAEVRRTKAPSVLLEIGYHDNAADAQWIAEHINLIAQTLVKAMTEYFGLPYVYPGPSQPGLAVTDSGGPVNLRAYPSAEGQVLTQIPCGATVTVFGQYRGWYVVLYNDTIGYANSAFIRL
mgnify:FL=1